MTISRLALAVGFLLGSWVASPRAAAQCLALELLDQAIATGQATPDSLALLLTLSAEAWEQQPGATPTWALWQIRSREVAPRQPLATVSLRRSNEHTYYDLVYKTRDHACLAQVRAGLKHRAKLLTEAATCVECEAERLVGYGYSVTLVNQKAKFAAGRTDYPYVLVMRRTNAAELGPEKGPAKTTTSSGEAKRPY